MHLALLYYKTELQLLQPTLQLFRT